MTVLEPDKCPRAEEFTGPDGGAWVYVLYAVLLAAAILVVAIQ